MTYDFHEKAKKKEVVERKTASPLLFKKYCVKCEKSICQIKMNTQNLVKEEYIH